MSKLLSDWRISTLEKLLKDAGFRTNDVRQLLHLEHIQNMLGYLRGTHAIVPLKKKVDLSRPVTIPFGKYKVARHEGNGVATVEKKGSNLCVDGRVVKLYVSDESKEKEKILGAKFHQELMSRGGLLNSSLLNFLMNHPEFFPDQWKETTEGYNRYIFFWDTIFFQEETERLFIPCCWWKKNGVELGIRCIENNWTINDAVAVV